MATFARPAMWQVVLDVFGNLLPQKRNLLAPLGLIASLSLLHAEPTFTGLGVPSGFPGTSTGLDVSPGGNFVVGYANFPSPSAAQAFRWTNGTMSSLGNLGEGTESRAYGVSDDGSAVAGFSYVGGSPHAFRWTPGGGMVDLGTLSGGIYSEAHAISADGNVVVGLATTTGGIFRAFRWTQAGGMQDIGIIPNGESSRAYAISANGSVIVGAASEEIAPFDEPSRAFRWTESGGMTNLGVLPGYLTSEARGISSSGAWITGFNESLSDSVPFRWTQSDGMVALQKPAGATFAKAWDIANDGTTVGEVVIGGTAYAYLWNPAGEAIELKTYLTSQGVDLTGWDLVTAEAISEIDGDFAITGVGTHNGIGQAYLVVLPEPSTYLLATLALLFLLTTRSLRRPLA